MIRPIKFNDIFNKVIEDHSADITLEKVYCLFRKELINALFAGGRYSPTGTFYYKTKDFKIRVSNHRCRKLNGRPTLSIVLCKRNIGPHACKLPDLTEIDFDMRALRDLDIKTGKALLRKVTTTINLEINDFLLSNNLLK